MKTNSAPPGFLIVAGGNHPEVQSPQLQLLWVLASAPLVIAGGLLFSVVLSEGALLKFAPGFEGMREALLFLLLTTLPPVSAAIEIDVRLKRLGVPEAESARGMLGFSSFLAFVVFLVGVAQAMARSTGRDAGMEILFCVLIVGICGPLLWSAAMQLNRTEHRLALLGGFVIAAVAMELAFDETAPDAEDRFFLCQSVLIALALTLRFFVWGLVEYHRPPAPGPES